MASEAALPGVRGGQSQEEKIRKAREKRRAAAVAAADAAAAGGGGGASPAAFWHPARHGLRYLHVGGSANTGQGAARGRPAALDDRQHILDFFQAKASHPEILPVDPLSLEASVVNYQGSQRLVSDVSSAALPASWTEVNTWSRQVGIEWGKKVVDSNPFRADGQPSHPNRIHWRKIQPVHQPAPPQPAHSGLSPPAPPQPAHSGLSPPAPPQPAPQPAPPVKKGTAKSAAEKGVAQPGPSKKQKTM